MALCNKFASKLNNIADSQFLKEPLMHFDLIMIWHPIIFKENVLLSNVLNKIPLFKEEKLSTEMNWNMCFMFILWLQTSIKNFVLFGCLQLTLIVAFVTNVSIYQPLKLYNSCIEKANDNSHNNERCSKI